MGHSPIYSEMLRFRGIRINGYLVGSTLSCRPTLPHSLTSFVFLFKRQTYTVQLRKENGIGFLPWPPAVPWSHAPPPPSASPQMFQALFPLCESNEPNPFPSFASSCFGFGGAVVFPCLPFIKVHCLSASVMTQVKTKQHPGVIKQLVNHKPKSHN